MAKAIIIDRLSDAIGDVLETYSKDVTEAIKEAGKTVAKEAVKEIAAASRRKSGKYARGWATKIAFDSPFEQRVVIYNKSKPQLTHLLEYGHAGPRPAPAYPHIRPVEQRAIEKFEKLVEKAVKG